jgi:hypothetical protein
LAFVVGCGLLPAEEDQLGTPPGDGPLAKNPDEAKDILDSNDGDDPDDPVVLPVQIDLSDGSDDLEGILDIIAESEKYVALDLTRCPMKDGVFGPLSDEGSAYITAIALPDAAIKIANRAFGAESGESIPKFPNLTYVSGKNVIEVGEYAFWYCKNLERVDLPKATSIGEVAFVYCTSLKTVNLPKATEIGTNAFWYCTSLETVNLPKVTEIGEFAFNGCTSLETVNLPKATEIGDYAFAETDGTALTITLSGTPPTIVGDVFDAFTVVRKNVTLKVPHKPTYDDNTTWKNSFTGRSNINLKIEQR